MFEQKPNISKLIEKELESFDDSSYKSIILKSTLSDNNPYEIFQKDFYISFKYCKDKDCDLRSLDRKLLIACLEKLMMLSKLSGKDVKSNLDSLKGLDHPVIKSGEYVKFFPRHEPDAELWHFYLDRNLGRVFFFIEFLINKAKDKPINLCHITRIVNKHPESK